MVATGVGDSGGEVTGRVLGGRARRWAVRVLVPVLGAGVVLVLAAGLLGVLAFLMFVFVPSARAAGGCGGG